MPAVPNMNLKALLSSLDQHTRVRDALDSAGSLTPVFQPIVELATGRIAGYEALTRFLDTDPVIPSDVWFAHARTCGLGPALEARAIEVALAVAGRPAETFLSLNLSPGVLLSDEVEEALPADLSGIVIELTENELFASGERLDRHLAELRERGAMIAVDDAGAGYAGLQQLIRIAPDILKLDRSLIQGTNGTGPNVPLLQALSTFATGTGAAVCAEGIEQADELQMLTRFDVTYAQGYILAEPGPVWPEIATEFLDEVTLKTFRGMRVTEPIEAGARDVTFGEVTGALARARSKADIALAMPLVERLTHSDRVLASRLAPGLSAVQTITHHGHDWESMHEHYRLNDYPTTEMVIADQVIGQVVRGDPSADPAELRLLAEEGFGAVLMVPVEERGDTVGLLELFREMPRPWTASQVDQACVIAHQLGSAIRHMSHPDDD